MGLFRSSNRPPGDVEEETQPDRARRGLTGVSARLARAGALAAVCGAGLLASAGAASATISTAAWNQAPSGPVVTFANQSSGYVAEDPGFSHVMGVQLDQWAATGVEGSPMSGANQAYTLVQQSDGNYLIVNRYTGLCMDDYGWGTQPGTEVDLYQCNGGANQEWSLATTSGPTTIINAYSGMAVQPADPNEGTGLVQATVDGQTNQQWTVAATEYDLATQAITVDGGAWVNDTGDYRCRSGYQFRPYSSSDATYQQQGMTYEAARTQEGDIGATDPTEGSYDPLSNTMIVVGDNGTSVHFDGNPSDGNLEYYHSTTPYQQTGQVMLYCDPS